MSAVGEGETYGSPKTICYIDNLPNKVSSSPHFTPSPTSEATGVAVHSEVTGSPTSPPLNWMTVGAALLHWLCMLKSQSSKCWEDLLRVRCVWQCVVGKGVCSCLSSTMAMVYEVVWFCVQDNMVFPFTTLIVALLAGAHYFIFNFIPPKAVQSTFLPHRR